MARWYYLFSGSKRTVTPIRPSLTLFFWLVGSFLLTLIPHVEQFPLWLSVVVVLALVIRSIMEIYRSPLPSTSFCAILAVCLLVGILLQFSTIFGRDAGTAFMAGLLAIKFFELHGPRDIALIIFSSFFVVMSTLLYSQALELFIYCLIMMWVLTGILLRVHAGDTPDNHLVRMLRQSAFIFLQALPLTVFLFVFLPRYTGKLQIGLDATSLGITDRVQPGSISRLADDDSTAFYAYLKGDIPNIETMYWRGLVLWYYQNDTWTQEKPDSRTGTVTPIPARLPKAVPHSSRVEQTIVIVPHFQKWLFALDCPISRAETAEYSNWSTPVSGGVLQISDQAGKLDHKEQYTVTSSPELTDQKLGATDPDYQKAILLPENEISPRVRALADQLYQANPEPKAYIRSVLHYFRSQHFVYSDSPGKAGKDPLDEFLFIKKAGFCEHFASAFAVLMRLEKCPARLIVGYQGAQYNPYKDFYTVKQSNAHAWDEVWIEAEHRWERVDPTAALSATEDQPFTLSNSSDQSEGEESLSIQIAHHRFTFLSPAHTPGWLRHTLLELQLRRQQIEADWDDWVFSYDSEAQDRLAQAMGFARGSYSILVFMCLAATGVCAGVFYRFIRQKRTMTPIENFYAQFCRNMKQRGMPRAIWEGPLDYTNRIAEAFPEKKEAIHDVGWLVACSRYGRLPMEAADPKKLKSLLLLITASNAASSSRAPS